MRASRPGYTVTEQVAGNGLSFIGKFNNKIIGFYSFVIESGNLEMTHLFVDPEYIGKGFGKQLWLHAIEVAKSNDWDFFTLCADPYAAEKFYLPMGCFQIGEIASSVRPTRLLPLLKYELN